ncbi:MAG: isocitrate lyase/PEP mutase family protein [Nocardioidaceae bacterium]
MTVIPPQRVASAEAFRALHEADDVLCLANVWDVATTRLVEAAGATAVATTSAGVAWSLGTADGDRVERSAAVDRVREIAAATDLPLSADVESGFASDAEGVGETVRRVIEAGAVGINIEDATHDGQQPLREPADQATRIAAAREAADGMGVPLYINARTDTYLLSVGPESGRLAETLDRAAGFLAAGADGVFVPGVKDPDTIRALVEGIDAPVNILVGPGSPSVAELRDLGVARVSLGSSIAVAAYALVRRGASELFGAGTYSSLDGGLPYGEVNDLLSR